MPINFYFSKDSKEICAMNATTDNIEIMVGNEIDEIKTWSHFGKYNWKEFLYNKKTGKSLNYIINQLLSLHYSTLRHGYK